MRVRQYLFALLLLLGCGVLMAAAPAANKFKLQPGAEGKLCLNCHPDFAEKLKSKFVHTPVKTAECSGCHNPHASRHGKLLFAPAKQICAKCHQNIIPDKTKSVHQVAAAGECAKCHDPHASNQKGNLAKAGNDLCAGCHRTLVDALAKVKFKHTPVRQGCVTCHDPHASGKSESLLKSPVPALCLECHNPTSPNFVRQHVNYPVATADCTSCHNPHGSNVAGILYDTVHQPVAAKRCAVCHDPATSPTPFRTRSPGLELCRGCHSTMLNATFGKQRVHWPLLDKRGCLNCHAAHAAKEKKLLVAEPKSLCARCHADTAEEQGKLAERERKEKEAARGRVIRGALTHQPVRDGDCALCHLPHASDSAHLMANPSVVESCGACHDWSKHSNHPMGPKVVDSRNKNLTMDCLSCHRSHGTGYRYLMPFPTSTDLCVQCHKKFTR